MKPNYLLLLLVLLSVCVSAQENGKDAVVAIPNMNILYFGIDNPVQIAVPGINSEKVSATVTNGSINKTSDGWVIRPSAASGTVNLSVLVNNQKVSEKIFRVKPIPAPHAVLAGKGVGLMSKNGIIEAGEIDTEMKDFLWDIKFEIVSYTFLYTENGNDIEISATGNKLTDEMKSIISNLQRGKNIVFKDIRAISPDNNSIYNISPLILAIN
jgi:gliding motility-associated protein GldM